VLEIASAADEFHKSLLTADADCSYDSLVEINLDTVCSLSLSAFYAPRRTHTYPFNGPFSGTTRVSRYQKGKTNLDFTEARDSEWQWPYASLHLAPDR